MFLAIFSLSLMSFISVTIAFAAFFAMDVDPLAIFQGTSTPRRVFVSLANTINQRSMKSSAYIKVCYMTAAFCTTALTCSMSPTRNTEVDLYTVANMEIWAPLRDLMSTTLGVFLELAASFLGFFTPGL